PAPAERAERADSGAIDAAVAGEWRNADFRERDQYRRPAQTLAFFGIQPSHTLVEITPGGGWYTEILAPLVREDGSYVAAVVDPERATSDSARDYATRQNAQLREKLAAHPEVYGPATVHPYDPADPVFGEPGSADAVVTFRNVHNWRMGGNAEAMFRGFYDVLAPGGVLGVVEHRAEGAVPDDDRSGYVGQEQVVALAAAAGFVLEEASEINANPADTRDHPNGVWTLPPSNRHDEADAERYAEIGESDRMTLRFRKPHQ
ncbi:class I SAM-dependent methyltransferase, partial [Alkalisalibacterium limincola]